MKKGLELIKYLLIKYLNSGTIRVKPYDGIKMNILLLIRNYKKGLLCNPFL